MEDIRELIDVLDRKGYRYVVNPSFSIFSYADVEVCDPKAVMANLNQLGFDYS